MACDLIPYPLLLKEKGDDCDAAPAGPSLSFRRGIEGEVAGHGRSDQSDISASGPLYGGVSPSNCRRIGVRAAAASRGEGSWPLHIRIHLWP